MDNYNDIKKAALAYVKQAFENAETHYPYHNWEHTKFVHNAIVEIINNTQQISEKEKKLLEIAAIFHDAGFSRLREEHEEVSASMVEEFLKEKNVSRAEIESVQKIIRATKMGTTPQNILEQIIQDADLAHIGKKKYPIFYNGLYEEIKKYHHPDLDYTTWKTLCLKFFDEHSYHTDYAKETFAPIKEKNKQKIMALENDTLPVVKSKKSKGKQNKKDIPEKGIETMFRVSLRNHLNLSRIADNKANTLISINAIIISIVLSALFPKLDSNPYLIYPGIALLAVNIVTIVIAILSVIPKTTHGKLTRQQVEEKEGNLIFFGNFHAMSLEDFEWGIDQVMGDREYLYKSLTRDLFFLGKVLNKKYRFLRIAYYIFIVGLIISISLFIFSLTQAEFTIN